MRILFFINFFFLGCLVVHAQESLATKACEDLPSPTLGTVTLVIKLPAPDPRKKERPILQPRAAEKILVEVVINRKGRVISAVATSGDPLLKAQARRSARKMTYPPLRGRNVKLRRGTIRYNMVPIDGGGAISSSDFPVVDISNVLF